MSERRFILYLASSLSLLISCSSAPSIDTQPSLLQPQLTEQQLRTLLGVPPEAQRVLILSQSSHLDINWRQSFDAYYSTLVEPIFTSAEQFLEHDARTFYSVAEMGFLEHYLKGHDAEPWRRHAQTGRMRIVGGGLTSPDTLLTTTESLTRDYLLGTVFAETTLGVRPRAAWLPDSFGHSPTVPDFLAAAGFESVGFGRADGARHSYEVVVSKLPRLMEGPSTASMLKELGSADFVWRGPGGGEVLAHYLPVREYCQGDAIDLDGFALGGTRLGGDRSDNKSFIRGKISEFIADLTPYAKTPYLFVPVGCDFQAPRPQLAEYAKNWNERDYLTSGTWVAVATFEDYMRLVGFHREALPVLERDINPVWTGFYATRPEVKRLARLAQETLTAVEPFLALAQATTSLDSAWHSVALSNHHDWITGTATDAVTEDEQIPLLTQALQTGEAGWAQVLNQFAEGVEGPEDFVVINSGPAERAGVVEIEVPGSGTAPLHVVVGNDTYPAQPIGSDRWAVAVGKVPSWGWRSFSLADGAVAGASAHLDGETATLSSGVFTAQLSHSSTGWALKSLKVHSQELLEGQSLEWVLYADSGGQYRIGSERLDCPDNEFTQSAIIHLQSLEVHEEGPARASLRATGVIDTQPITVELVAEAGVPQLIVRVEGAARKDKTVALRVRPAQPEAELVMGVPGGVAKRALTHRYTPSLWPAVTWASRGTLAVHLGQSTAVHGLADGALEWVVFRNAEQESACDDVGPPGQSKGTQKLEFSLGAREPARDGATELEAALALTRPLRTTKLTATQSRWPATGQLVSVDSARTVVTAIKPASRGEGWVMHLERPGKDASPLAVRKGVISWANVTQPDVLERDDVPFGAASGDSVEGSVTQSVTALRLSEK